MDDVSKFLPSAILKHLRDLVNEESSQAAADSVGQGDDIQFVDFLDAAVAGHICLDWFSVEDVPSTYWLRRSNNLLLVGMDGYDFCIWMLERYGF